MNTTHSQRHAYVLAGIIGSAAGLILAGYEFIRSPSRTLLVEFYGKQSLPTVMIIVPIAALLFVYVYGRLVSRFGPRHALSISTIGSAGAIIMGWYGVRSGIRIAAPFLYILGSAYVVLLIEQYWSLINSALTESEAKRVNGPICGIGSIGAIAGGLIGERATMVFGTADMVLIAGLITIPAMFLSSFAYRFVLRNMQPRNAVQLNAPAQPKLDHSGLKLLRSDRTLQLLLFMILSTQSLITALNILWQGHLSDAFVDADQQTAYSFHFYAIINTLAAIGQFVIAPVLLIFVRNQTIQLIMPLVILSFIGVYFNDPGLQTAGWAFMAFKALDYSIFRSSKEIYYIPMTFDARYRSKEVIDVFGYRLGKGGTGLFFDLLQRFGAKFSEASYGVWSACFGVIWFGISLRLRAHVEKRNKMPD